jgi:hypothetical protein
MQTHCIIIIIIIIIIKLKLKYKPRFTGEITLHVAQTVNTEQLQQYKP